MFYKRTNCDAHNEMYQLHWTLSFLSIYLSARRNMFLVCSVASVIKESINMAKKENTWTTMISHWLPLHDSTYLRSFECSCQLYKSSLQRRNHFNFSPLDSLFPFKNHIVTLSNMIKTIMHFSLGSILSLCNWV